MRTIVTQVLPFDTHCSKSTFFPFSFLFFLYFFFFFLNLKALLIKPRDSHIKVFEDAQYFILFKLGLIWLAACFSCCLLH